MKQLEIADILKNHLLWVHQRAGGSRADLSLKDLRHYNFDAMTLRRAKMAGANFSNCSMRGADLGNARLNGANLANANFTNANLKEAVLDGALLAGTKFDGANLQDTSMENIRDALPDAAGDEDYAVAGASVVVA